MLVHLIDVSEEEGRDPVADLEVLERELQGYDPELGAKPRLLVASKIDCAGDGAALQRLETWCHERGEPLWKISAVAGDGLDSLVTAVRDRLETIEPVEGTRTH